jgi:hypothetical protein
MQVRTSDRRTCSKIAGLTASVYLGVAKRLI